MILEKRYLNMIKKLFCFAAPVLLLAVAGVLLLCKRHAKRTGLACLDSDL